DEQVHTLFDAIGKRNERLAEQLQHDDGTAQLARTDIHSAVEHHEHVCQLLAELDDRINAATAALPEVQQIRARSDEITLLTGRLSEQKEDAEKEAADKRLAYEDDRFFLYLWKRGYGTPRYQAGALAARFDRWLAERCHYRDNAGH